MTNTSPCLTDLKESADKVCELNLAIRTLSELQTIYGDLQLPKHMNPEQSFLATPVFKYGLSYALKHLSLMASDESEVVHSWCAELKNLEGKA